MYSEEHKIFLRKIKRKKILITITQILILVLLLVIWELFAKHEIINTFISSSPSRILNTIIDLYDKGNLFKHIWITLYETIISFGFGTILGIIIAIILWWNNFVYKVIDPYLTVINSLPKVALGPIIIIFFI